MEAGATPEVNAKIGGRYSHWNAVIRGGRITLDTLRERI